MAIGATLMDIKKATTLASITGMTFMLAGGFFIKVKRVFLLHTILTLKFVRDPFDSHYIHLLIYINVCL